MKKLRPIALPLVGGALCGLLSACSRDTPPEPDKHQQTAIYAPYVLEKNAKSEQVQVRQVLVNGQRQFHLGSTQAQRDDKPQERLVEELPGSARVVSGSPLFDGLFAQAMDDLRQASVNEIRDGFYNGGEAIPCECFETGEKWTYVWTRDLAYAADLALAYMSPTRTANALRFKTSPLRPGIQAPEGVPADSWQIIQDTGSGGSWPVSTDRVTWALAAETLLNSLHGEARQAFADHAYRALRGTLEADRLAVFDARDGLYGGEQSYLDWRTQTYAPWITNNLARMSSSKALSTNVAHYQALRLGARLAQERGEAELAQRYNAWADALKTRISDRFWLAERNLFASLINTAEDPAPVHKFDMLGNALAVLYGIATVDQAAALVANYPHAPYGVPVYYPHQPEVYVYHNRAIWPFVSAYALRAAKKAGNQAVVDHTINSLMRAAALNLSNMENLEWLTAKPFYDDGPAINSRRQLWSVAAYLNLVAETYFGYQPGEQGLTIAPFLTSQARRSLGAGDKARLENMAYQGLPLTIELLLPPEDSADGVYPVVKLEVNGKPHQGAISRAMLAAEGNLVRVHFAPLGKAEQAISLVPKVDPLSHNAPEVFSPEAPEITRLALADQHFVIDFNHRSGQQGAGKQEVSFNLYRNGQLIAEQLPLASWKDPEPARLDARQCFALEAVFSGSGHRSHHSEPQCYAAQAQQTIAVDDARVSSNLEVSHQLAGYSAPVLFDWGKPDDRLQLRGLVLASPGTYAVQLVYNNRQHTIDTGVTAAVKQVLLRNAQGELVHAGVVQMPNVEDRDGAYPLRDSTEVVVQLPAGEYQLEVRDFFNMSYLEANKTYTGSGGIQGPVNRASIAAFKLTRLGD